MSRCARTLFLAAPALFVPVAFAAAPAWAAGEDPPSIKTDANVDVLARIGVVILLFEVGLESTVPT